MRAKSGNGSVPAYQKIQVAIRERIESGDLRPGDLVSSERELARLHEVSLMTARHALDFLQREGVVERRRGVGTYVSAPKIQFNKLMGYMELMASRGLSARSKVVYSGVRNDEYGIATRLSLPSTCPLIKIERVRLVADEPFSLETCFLSAKEFSPRGLLRFLFAWRSGRRAAHAMAMHHAGSHRFHVLLHSVHVGNHRFPHIHVVSPT